MRILLICNYKPGAGGISGQVELLRKHLQEEGHSAEIFSTKASTLRRLLLPMKLHKAAKQCDVLHIHCCSGWGFLPAALGIAVGRRMKKRLVLTYHGGGGEDFFDRHPRLVRHCLSLTNTNIVHSGFLAKVFEKHHLPCCVIPNIVDLDESLFRQRETLSANFICTRAHEPLYNIACILRAFRQVQEIHPEASLNLVGDGSEHQNLMKLTQELKAYNVTFTGRVDNSEIFHHLDRADIFLSSSTVDNMPVSVLEAMGAGLLVIASRVGGVPYIIRNCATGLLFDNDDDAELARQMLWALENQTIAKAVIRQARRAVASYSWVNVKEKILTTYGIPA